MGCILSGFNFLFNRESKKEKTKLDDDDNLDYFEYPDIIDQCDTIFTPQQQSPILILTHELSSQHDLLSHSKEIQNPYYPTNPHEIHKTNTLPISIKNRRMSRRRSNSFPFELTRCEIMGCTNSSTYICRNCKSKVCERCLYDNVYTQNGGAHIIYCVHCNELFIL